MKKLPIPVVVTLVVIAVCAGGFLVWSVAVGGKNQNADLTHPDPAAAPMPPPDTTSTDSVAVFQKAFWRRPGEDDRILHAERREWRDGNGVSQWQWFLAVEPSPALVKYLRGENAFGLATDTSGAPAAAAGRAGDYQKPPAWFPSTAEGFDVLRSPSSALRLLFSKTANQLYATDSGHGFRPGAPEPAAAAPASAPGSSLRRLPDAPPPNPPPQ